MHAAQRQGRRGFARGCGPRRRAMHPTPDSYRTNKQIALNKVQMNEALMPIVLE